MKINFAVVVSFDQQIPETRLLSCSFLFEITPTRAKDKLEQPPIKLKFFYCLSILLRIMQGLNKASLIGHLGKDPALVSFENGKLLAKFTLATSESFRDDTGQVRTQTDWHQIIVWGKTAEYAKKHLSKGQLVYVEGKIRTRSFEDGDKHKRYVTEIVAEKLIHLEKKQKHEEENLPTQEELDNDMKLPF